MISHESRIDEITERYPASPEYLIFMLQDVQKSYGYIPPEAMDLICEQTGVPASQAYSVATFYQSFRLEPQGEHTIKVCLGTACHLKGGQRIMDELKRRLQVEPGETTPDMKFTYTSVNCVGACALAPVMVIDDQYYPSITVRKLEKQLKALSRE